MGFGINCRVIVFPVVPGEFQCSGKLALFKRGIHHFTLVQPFILHSLAMGLLMSFLNMMKAPNC